MGVDVEAQRKAERRHHNKRKHDEEYKADKCKRSKAYYKNNSENLKAYQRNRRKMIKEGTWDSRPKKRADDKKRVLNRSISKSKTQVKGYELTREQHASIIFGNRCHYCGKIEHILNDGTWHCGIDRMLSDIGYTFNNCVPACKGCNLAKNRYPYEVWMELNRQTAFYQVQKYGLAWLGTPCCDDYDTKMERARWGSKQI